MGAPVSARAPHKGNAGYVAGRRTGANLATGRGWVTVYRAEEQGIPASDGGPWAIVCETHGTLLQIETRAAALTVMRSGSTEFCEQCRVLSGELDGSSLSEVERRELYGTGPTWTKDNGMPVGADYARARLRREARRWRDMFTAEESESAIERIVTDRTRNGELVSSLCRSFLDVVITLRAERDA